jgi:hypothetical protein
MYASNGKKDVCKHLLQAKEVCVDVKACTGLKGQEL